MKQYTIKAGDTMESIIANPDLNLTPGEFWEAWKDSRAITRKTILQVLLTAVKRLVSGLLILVGALYVGYCLYVGTADLIGQLIERLV